MNVMIKMIISPHARDRMKLRHVTEGMIAETVIHPEQHGYGYQERLLAWKKVGELYLKVVYTVEDDTYHIITVIMQSKI